MLCMEIGQRLKEKKSKYVKRVDLVAKIRFDLWLCDYA